MKILFITSGQLPVPAVDGGAVETLLENYIKENEFTSDNDITVISCESKAARAKSNSYKKTEFVFVRYNFMDKIRDSLIFFWHTYVTKDWRVMFLKNKWKKKRFEKYLNDNVDFSMFDRVIVENNMSLLPVLQKKMGAESFSKKCCYHMHSVFIDNPSCIPQMVDCKALFTVSEFVKGQICKDYSDLNSANIKVVVNGIDTQLFNKIDSKSIEKSREKFEYSNDDIVFLYVGRISPEKGVLELVHAFKKMDLLNKKLLLVGCSYQGENKKSFYEKQIDDEIKNCSEQIKKIGYVENYEVNELYNMANVVVIPSIVGDAGPLNLLEAMAAQANIVASSNGGIPEYSKKYHKIRYAAHNESYEDNLMIKMQEAVAFSDKSIENDAFLFDRKFYYDELTRAILEQN